MGLDLQPTFIGVKESIDPKHQQDIPVLKPWNTGCFIGIPITAYEKKPYNWIGK